MRFTNLILIVAFSVVSGSTPRAKLETAFNTYSKSFNTRTLKQQLDAMRSEEILAGLTQLEPVLKKTKDGIQFKDLLEAVIPNHAAMELLREEWPQIIANLNYSGPETKLKSLLYEAETKLNTALGNPDDFESRIHELFGILPQTPDVDSFKAWVLWRVYYEYPPRSFNKPSPHAAAIVQRLKEFEELNGPALRYSPSDLGEGEEESVEELMRQEEAYREEEADSERKILARIEKEGIAEIRHQQSVLQEEHGLQAGHDQAVSNGWKQYHQRQIERDEAAADEWRKHNQRQTESREAAAEELRKYSREQAELREAAAEEWRKYNREQAELREAAAEEWRKYNREQAERRKAAAAQLGKYNREQAERDQAFSQSYNY